MQIRILVDLCALMRIPEKKPSLRILLSLLECQTLHMRVRNKYIKLTGLSVSRSEFIIHEVEGNDSK